MNSVPKRVRGTNFTKEEQLILAEEVGKYKKIIENKTTNKISCNEKVEAWRNIERGFNSKVSPKRNLQQLQAKYENLKTEVRKVMAAQQWGLKGTGGGPFKDIKDDPVLLAILDIINKKTVVGLSSPFDSDLGNEDEKKEIQLNEIEVLSTADTEIVDNHQVLTCEILPETIFIDNFTNSLELETPSTKECHASYGSNISPFLKSVGSISMNTMKPQTSMKENCVTVNSTASVSAPSTSMLKRKLQAEETENWSDYTPRKLKKPVSQKLRPVVCSPLAEAKEKYYIAKRLLVEKQLEVMIRKEERDQEEHDKKMALDLETEKKK